MYQKQKFIDSTPSILFSLLRIYPHEFSRVFISWIFRFLYRFSLVLGWTFIVSYFASKFGEGSLSYLFLAHAVLVTFGSLVFLRISRYFSLENLFLWTILLAGGLLLYATTAAILHLHDNFWSLVVIFFVEAFILVQLSINFDTFIERLFTPIESERTFPVIESADTLAALIGGFFLFFFSSFSLFTLLWVLIGALFSLLPILLFYQNFVRTVPKFSLSESDPISNEILHETLNKAYKTTKKHGFARHLAWVVFFQWAVAIFLEFLFVVSLSEKAFSHLPATSSGVENIFIHEFGFLYILFGAAAFLSQIFLAPRVISLLGIVPSMILYPLIYLFSMIGIVGSFGFFTTVFARLNAEISGGIYRNAYQSTYYVFEEKESQSVRSFLEGVIRPFGVFAGSAILLFAKLFVPEKFFLVSIIFSMFFAVLIFLYFTSGLQKDYLQTVTTQLFSPHVDENLKLNLLEIFHQKGNENGYSIFYKLLDDPSCSSILRLKIFELLSDDPEFLPRLFPFVSAENHETRLTALLILKKFAKREYFSQDRYFSRQTALQILKNRFVNEHHDEIRLLILECLALISGKEAGDFFISLLERESGESLANVIVSCRFFRDNALTSILEPFLQSQDPRIWASACIALEYSSSHRRWIFDSVWTFLKNPHPLHILQAMRVIRAFREYSFLEYLKAASFQHLESYEDIHFFQIFTLAVLRDQESIFRFFEFLIVDDIFTAEKAHHLLSEFPDTIRTVIENHLHRHVSLKLSTFGKFSDFGLRRLRTLYLLLGSFEDVLRIDHLLHEKDPSYHSSIPISLYI